MKIISTTIVMGFLIISSFSCGTKNTGNDGLRMATDAPDFFDSPDGLDWGDCINTLIDPMDGTELILVHSRDGFGNYRVLGRKYGISKGELLRINCYTGEVIGIVRGR